MALAKPAAADDIDSILLTVADECCVYCGGLGTVTNVRRTRACRCVWRAIYRAVRGLCSRIDAYPAGRCLHAVHGFSRPGEEFLSDAALCRKVLTTHLARVDSLMRRLHWRDACRAMGCDGGAWWHNVYRVQEALGRAYYQRGLYPFHTYFHERQLPPQAAVRTDRDRGVHHPLSRITAIPREWSPRNCWSAIYWRGARAA